MENSYLFALKNFLIGGVLRRTRAERVQVKITRKRSESLNTEEKRNVTQRQWHSIPLWGSVRINWLLATRERFNWRLTNLNGQWLCLCTLQSRHVTYVDDDGRRDLGGLVLPAMVAGHDGPWRVGRERVRRLDGVLLRRPVDVVSRALTVRLVVVLHLHDIFYPWHEASHE